MRHLCACCNAVIVLSLPSSVHIGQLLVLMSQQGKVKAQQNLLALGRGREYNVGLCMCVCLPGERKAGQERRRVLTV